MLEGIDVFVGGLGLVGVMVTVAVWVLVLRTVEQPTRKMKVDKMMRRIVRSKNLGICSPDMRIILKEPGYEIANTNQTQILSLQCGKLMIGGINYLRIHSSG